MRLLLGSGTGLVLLVVLPSLGTAQVPGVPGGAPGAAPVGAGPGATPPAAPAPANLWSFLCATPDQVAACKAKFCNTMFGQFISNGLKPSGALTGGIIGPCCPDPGLNNLQAPPDSALGAAARIQQDEAESKKRRAAVRYLGTVDCNYWPEARDALINALRADRNECVRLEAALALSRGCCCNKPIIKALTLTVSGSREDGNPAESCERVKMAAAVALSHCLSCYVEVEPVPIPKKVVVPVVPKKPEVLPEPEPKREDKGPPVPPEDKLTAPNAALQPLGYQEPAQQRDGQNVIQAARQALMHSQIVVTGGSESPAGPPTPSCKNGLIDLIGTAFSGSSTVQTPPPQVLAPVRNPVVSTQPPAGPIATQGTVIEIVHDGPPGAPEAAACRSVTVTPICPTQGCQPGPKPVPAPQRTIFEALRDRLSGSQEPTPGKPVSTVKPVPGCVTPVETDSPPKVVPQSSYGTCTPVSVLPRSAYPDAPIPPAQDRAVAESRAPATSWRSSGEVARPWTLDSSVTRVYLAQASNGSNAFAREQAILRLSAANPADQPSVVRTLLTRATEDEDSLVRAACLRSLMALKVKDPPLQEVLRKAQGDADPRVRLVAQEVRNWLETNKAR